MDLTNATLKLDIFVVYTPINDYGSVDKLS